MTAPHLNATATPQKIALPHCDGLIHIPRLLTNGPDLMAALLTELELRTGKISMFGKTSDVPRLVAVQGRSMDPGSNYRRPNPTQPFSSLSQALLTIVQEVSRPLVDGWHPNGLIANYYRDGSDCVGWHSDDEPALGESPIVASLSFGGTRRFLLKPRSGGACHELLLRDGDFVLMTPGVQEALRHCIPKTSRAVPPRLSMTYRQYRSGQADGRS